MSPYQVALELDRDPERLALTVMPMLDYAHLFSQFKHAKDPEQISEAIRKTELYQLVEENDFERARAKRARVLAERAEQE